MADTDRLPIPEGITIAVMGSTGTGKTTFINLASKSSLKTSSGLRSCTTDVGISNELELDGVQVTLIDTPGFDDTMVSDTEILQRIAFYLATSYQEGMKLSGIIYLHRITDTRMTGNSRTNIRMFKRLCGEDTLKNVVIVTNMWGKFPASAEEVREQQLRTDELFYKPILDRGGVMLRHDNTEQSAREILRHLIRNHPESLKIQKEIVDEKKDVTQTQACELLDREAREQYRQAIQRLEERMARALKIKDEETQADIQREKQEMDEKLAKVEHERSELLNTFEQEKRRFEETMRNFQSQLEGEREEALGLKRAEEKLKQEIVRLQEQLERINQESEDKIRELECRVTHQEILIEEVKRKASEEKERVKKEIERLRGGKRSKWSANPDQQGECNGLRYRFMAFKRAWKQRTSK